MFSFSSIPQVTKNILILNGLFYLATMVLMSKGIDLISLLGAHYVNSPLFKPFQIITYFFMHSNTDFFHILFNMLMLVMFGSHLERIWGPKRFFIFYIASAIGAFALYNLIGVYEIHALKVSLSSNLDIEIINNIIRESHTDQDLHLRISTYLSQQTDYTHINVPDLIKYIQNSYTPMVGASGAVFGIMAAFAYLFPNTELMLLFPPIPVKAKYLISVYFLYELYKSIYMVQGDNVAHLAHVGGAVTGFILVFIWNKNRKTFY
jgi:membrane associated rhomboid family serine protease